jgi:hypothetical protein
MLVDLAVIGYFTIYRRKALIYIDLFNIKQPPAQIRTGATNAYGSYIESKVKALNKLILHRYFPQHFKPEAKYPML